MDDISEAEMVCDRSSQLTKLTASASVKGERLHELEPAVVVEQPNRLTVHHKRRD